MLPGHGENNGVSGQNGDPSNQPIPIETSAATPPEMPRSSKLARALHWIGNLTSRSSVQGPDIYIPEPGQEEPTDVFPPSSFERWHPDDAATYLDVAHDQRRGIALADEAHWEEQDPKELIDAFINELPDHTTLSYASIAEAAPLNHPSNLELFFLSKTPPIDSSIDLTHKAEGALIPTEAIYCMRDKVRTKRFLQAIADSIAELDTGESTIEVCDAGSGPIPLMAIYAALCSDKVRCTALELNPASAELARRVIENFGLQDRVTVIETDATTYEPERPLDLLVSETMHVGLTVEPLVKILSNLQPHVKTGGKVIPGAVTLKAALVPRAESDNPSAHIRIWKTPHIALLDTPWKTVLQYVAGDQLDKIKFTLDHHDLPADEYILAVTNDVTVGNHTLTPNDSLLTIPQFNGSRDRVTSEGNNEVVAFYLDPQHSSTIAVSYKPGGRLLDAATYIPER